MRGIGVVTVGKTIKETQISRDVYEHTIQIIKNSMSIGGFTPAPEPDLWDMEYWSLEQAKLGKVQPRPLEGRNVYITGGGSGIGRASAKAFAKAGANLFLADININSLKETKAEIDALKCGVAVQYAVVNVTSEEEVQKSVEDCVTTLSGVDVIISNAGAAFQGPIAETDNFEQSMKLNFWSHHYVSKYSTLVFLKQNLGAEVGGTESNEKVVPVQAEPMGGCLLYNVSKAALNPGPLFGPYAVAKAATLALMKQYALDYGEAGIRCNAVNPDRIRTNLFAADVLESRAKARGISTNEYFSSNLLKKEVTADDVAKAFLDLALLPKTSACILTVDGGNIAASPR